MTSPSRRDPDPLGELAGRAARGDQQAFAQLHATLSPGLSRHFSRLLAGAGVSGGDRSKHGPHPHGPHPLADELAQQAWILLWRTLQAGKYDPSRARLSTFLYAIASNVWLQYGRQRARDAAQRELTLRMNSGTAVGPDGTPGGSDAAGPVSGPEVLATAEAIELVRDAMAGRIEAIGPELARALRAAALGQSDRELARQAGISPSTANAQKRAASQLLADLLRSRGLDGAGFDSPE